MPVPRVRRIRLASFVLLPPLLALGWGARAPVPTATAQQVSVSGWFHVIWRDFAQATQFAQTTQLDQRPLYVLIDDQGVTTRLLLDENLMRPLGGPLALNRKRVRITGLFSSIGGPGQQTQVGRSRSSEVQSIQYENPLDAQAFLEPERLSGPQPWVNVLCRFGDIPATPHPVSWFQAEMGTTYPGMDHYWRAASEDRINISGTTVVGWYDLPQPRSYYVYDQNGDGTDDLDHARAAADCTAAADADVYYPDFVGINMMFNEVLDCCAWGGSWSLNLDGQVRVYRITWLPPWGYDNVGVISHEMGHGFGLPHSSGPYDAVYDSRWDVMSNIWGNCPPNDPTYGCIGVHTISYHKDQLGWIPPEQKYVAASGSMQTILLERLGEPTVTTEFLMAQIPITGAPNEFYTVEVRRLAGYDVTLPGKAVIIHRVNTAGSRPARVVDPDMNGDPNDAAAIWLPGETFTDVANETTVTVEEETASGFVVTIAYRVAPIALRVGDPPNAVPPGDQIDIPIIMDMSEAGGIDLASIQFEVSWNPGLLTYISTTPGAPAGWSVVLNETQTESGLLAVAAFSVTGTTNSFTAVTLVLDAGLVEGNTLISADVTAAGNQIGNDLLSRVFEDNLLLCIGAMGLLGDVNDDGIINIVDAQQVARHSVGLDTPNAPMMQDLGDVNEDGDINIIDAQQIAQYSIGLDTPNAPNLGNPIAGGCGAPAPSRAENSAGNNG